MLLDNRTRYRSSDLEAVILLALEEAGITAHAKDRVLVSYGRSFSGFCYFGFNTPNKLRSGKLEPRMALCVPDPRPSINDAARRAIAGKCPTHGVPCVEEDGPPLAMYPEGSRHMKCPVGCAWIQTRRELPPDVDQPLDIAAFVWLVRHEVGHWRGLDHKQMHPTMRRWEDWKKAGKPLPAWAASVSVAIDEAPPPRARKARPDPNVARAKRADHARVMLAKAERKAKLAATLVKRWTRRVSAAERAVDKAATKTVR